MKKKKPIKKAKPAPKKKPTKAAKRKPKKPYRTQTNSYPGKVIHEGLQATMNGDEDL